MWSAAEVMGAASTRPTMPKRPPAAMVTIRTTSGLRSSVAPKAMGCTICCRMPCASSTRINMTTAVALPSVARAMITVKAPETKAPMKGT